MKKLITYLLGTAVGKAIVEALIQKFIEWIEKKGFAVYRLRMNQITKGGGGEDSYLRNEPMYPIAPEQSKVLSRQFADSELDKI